MLTLLRRLAALTLVASALLAALAWVTPASAAPPECTCTTADTEQLARQANDVFTGTVVSSTAAPKEDGSKGSVLTHDVTVELVYKGDMRESTAQVRTVSGSPCDLRRLPNGTQYTFFVALVDDVLVADGCGGTRAPDATLVAELEALYGAGEPPRTAAPVETAEIEKVSGVEPPMTVTRAAAPGAAMVLVGLLGLVVVRRLGRR